MAETKKKTRFYIASGIDKVLLAFHIKALIVWIAANISQNESTEMSI